MKVSSQLLDEPNQSIINHHPINKLTNIKNAILSTKFFFQIVVNVEINGVRNKSNQIRDLVKVTVIGASWQAEFINWLIWINFKIEPK